MASKIMKDKVQEYLEKAHFYYDLPGLALGISLGPAKEENFTFAVGWQDAIKKLPLKENQVFHMASVTKLLVGTSLLQLWEKGLVDLDGLLTDYLPDFQMADGKYKEVTIRQMLAHTSALPDVEDYRWYDPEIDEGALARYVYSDGVRGAKLLGDPGGGSFAYSNIAYEALGLVIAQVSGQTFEAYVEENIFKPAAMADSDLLSFRRDKASLVAPHYKDDDNHFQLVEHYPYNRAHGPSSTLTSTLGDMNNFAQVYMAGKLLGPKAMEEAWQEQATVPNNQEKICLAWFKREQGGHYLYGHEGNDDGFRSSFWICPDLNLSITVCCNLSRSPVKRINREIFQVLLEEFVETD